MVFWPTKIIHCLGAGLLIGYQTWEFRTTTHVDYDLLKGLYIFETQWVYFIGLAFPTAVLVDFLDTFLLKKGVIAPESYSPKFGNLILFPILVLLSHDPNGCGNSIIDKKRTTNLKLNVIRALTFLHFSIARIICWAPKDRKKVE